MERIRQVGVAFAAQRPADYLAVRRGLEKKVREIFAARGGQPRTPCPHYLVLGPTPWIRDWYATAGEVSIQLADVDPTVVSFTYGDSYPAMRFQDGRPYRGQVYTLHELPGLISRYGLPQDWNADGRHGPERYIEAQVWDDEPIRRALLALGQPWPD